MRFDDRRDRHCRSGRLCSIVHDAVAGEVGRDQTLYQLALILIEKDRGRSETTKCLWTERDCRFDLPSRHGRFLTSRLSHNSITPLQASASGHNGGLAPVSIFGGATWTT